MSKLTACEASFPLTFTFSFRHEPHQNTTNQGRPCVSHFWRAVAAGTEGGGAILRRHRPALPTLLGLPWHPGAQVCLQRHPPAWGVACPACCGQSSLGTTGADEDEDSEANSAPIVRYVDLVLEQAMREQASDIHFEPFEDDFKIRYRVDGALYEMAPPPLHLSNTIISRIKVMSNLNIAERRIPQDGRIVMSQFVELGIRTSSSKPYLKEKFYLLPKSRTSVRILKQIT